MEVKIKSIVMFVLLLIVLLLGYNFPLRYEGVQGRGVYTLEVYNVLNIKLYDYVIE